MNSPTFAHDDNTSQTGKQQKNDRPLFVGIKLSARSWEFHRAHIRHHKGYYQVCWREGKKIRTQHISKKDSAIPTAVFKAKPVQIEKKKPPRKRSSK